MSNTNRDYAIVYDIKNSSLVLSRPLVFYITDKNTSNIFIRLVTKTNIGDGVDQYTDIENASNYILIMRVIKPNDEVTSIRATQREAESIFEFDLTENFKDIPGIYICELIISTIVNSRQELITSDLFSYEVKRSILSRIDEIIEHEDTTVEKLLNDLEATKAELSSQVEVERKRIDSLAKLTEGSTTGDAELIDARIGIDMITYDNLGSSIRTQLSCLSEVSRFINLYNPDNITENKYINYGEGTALDYTGSDNYCVTDYINIHSNTILAIKNMLNIHFAFYDSNKTVINNMTNSFAAFNGGINYNNSGWDYMISPQNAKYVRFTLTKPSIRLAAVVEVATMNDITTNLNFKYAEYNERIRPIGYNEFKGNAKKIKDIETIIDSICEKGNNIFNKNTVTVGYYINEDGMLLENSSYVVSDFIPVNEGETISSNTSLRFVSCYDNNKKFLTSLPTTKKFVVPKNTNYIRLTIDVSLYKNAMVSIGESEKEYEEYSGYKIKATETLKKTIEKCINEINQTNIVGGLQVSADTISANNSLLINGFPNNLKKSISLSFYCKFDSFSEILIGKGYNSYRGDWLKITNTTIAWQHYEQSIQNRNSVEHRLNLSNYIMITMYIDNNSKCTVNLTTLNGSFSTSFQFGYEVNGIPFVLSSSNITDVTFSITGQDFGKDVWMFGDSYFGVAEDRIIGQLKNIGFTNALIDGLAGQVSGKAYDELMMCLNFGTPKYLVWCLGMNDDDTSYTANLNKVISLCENKNIKLIVMKIPTVPSRSKENINNFIETKGLRYIDAYKAVNANSNGEWYDSYLSSDGVHPTNLGAKAIAMRILVDVPEIMQYGMSQGNITGGTTGDK